MKNTIGLNPSDYVEKIGNRYKLKSFVVFESSLNFLRGFEYYGACVQIFGNSIRIENFLWDGMTKIHDGKKDKNGIPFSWLESCLHDSLKYEKHVSGKLSLSDHQIDLLFKEVMSNNKRWYRGIVYIGVRCFGWLFNGNKK